MTKYAFLFRVRQQGALGSFDEFRCVEVQAESYEPLVEVADRAGTVLRKRYPDVESGGIARCARDGEIVRPQFFNH